MTEAQIAELHAMRNALDGLVVKIADNPVEVNSNMVAIRTWNPATYVMGDVRMYDGIPYRCVQPHDSTQNPTWTPEATPALWMQYHGTTPETARPWIMPTGVHDMYKVGECMIWTDGVIYRCVENTVYSPDNYAQAWERVD